MGRSGQRILLGAAGAVLAAGAYAVAALGSGERVSRGFIGVETFGAWRLICVSGPAPLDGLLQASAAGKSTANACRVNQEVPLSRSTPADVILAANFSLVGARKIPALMLRLPATAQAGETIGLRLDNRQDVKAAVRDCGPMQCIAAGNLSAGDWRALLQAKSAQLRFPAAGGQMVLVDLQLDGLTGAIAAMTRAESF